MNPFLELGCSFVAEGQYQNLLRVYVLLTDQVDNTPNKSLCFPSSWSRVKNHRSSKSGSCFFLFGCWRFAFRLLRFSLPRNAPVKALSQLDPNQ